jgi:hypothetical protein
MTDAEQNEKREELAATFLSAILSGGNFVHNYADREEILVRYAFDYANIFLKVAEEKRKA